MCNAMANTAISGDVTDKSIVTDASIRTLHLRNTQITHDDTYIYYNDLSKSTIRCHRRSLHEIESTFMHILYVLVY